MRSNIIALWMVHAQSYDHLAAEAESDCFNFGVDAKVGRTPTLSATEYELQLVKCSPAKIENSRVELWKGWAVITWGYVEPQLILTTIAEEERSISERQWQASLSS